MLRISRNVLNQQAARIFVSSRFTSTDPTAGSINAAHDKFAEREQALENLYFRKQNEELLVKLRQLHESLEQQSVNIDRELTRIEQEIKRLETQREQLMKMPSKMMRQ